MNEIQNILERISTAAAHRRPAPEKTQAYRLFNGFYEGYPDLVIDRYGPTLVLLDHGESGPSQPIIEEIVARHQDLCRGCESILLKQRQHTDMRYRNGVLLAGDTLPSAIEELGVPYALDLQLNQDASFYLDTRDLRAWLLEHMAGKRVLNTFAYTGSLGVAAGVGGAEEVIQTDLNQNFLQLAQKSWQLNDLDPKKHQILAGDFFKITNRLRHSGRLFDTVILDPPFFSTTKAGRVDLQNETTRLINKVRPLIAHNGTLVVINNALFTSGADLMGELESLTASDYLAFERIIPIPEDITGYPETIQTPPPTDPSPFNHPTKIAILRVFRKDKRH